MVQHNYNELLAIRRQLREIINYSECKIGKSAIFYDIENLLRGYNFSQELLESLSLKEIANTIRKTGKIDQFAVQKAYANWSDPRLKTMRVEINELGIDPIQVFGFSRERTKNAADIQLVIDAINLANLRPSIDTFVIVSGDGGFASLAKYLHECGKKVICCAYKSSASKTFQSVCDGFVEIVEPDVDRRYTTNLSSSVTNQSDVPDLQNTHSNDLTKKMASSLGNNQLAVKEYRGLDPRNARLINEINPRKTAFVEESVALTQEILNWYANDQTCQKELLKAGIHLSIVEQAVRLVILEFQTAKFGFRKFIEYMQYICKSTKFCVARVPPSKVVIALRDSIPEKSQILPDLDSKESNLVVTSSQTIRNQLQGYDGLDPRNARLINQIEPRKTASAEESVALTQEILNWYANDQTCQKELLKAGIHLSIVEQAVRYVIPEVQTIQLGLPKFIEYMQYICKSTKFCVARVPPSKVVIALRDSIPKESEVLPDLDVREIHSVDTYRAILTMSSPIYRIPPATELYTITNWIVEHPIYKADLGTIIEDIVAGLNGEVSSDVVKQTLSCFLTVGLLMREPLGVPTSEQKLSWQDSNVSLEVAIYALRSKVAQKLANVIPDYSEELLQQIIPTVL
uniref:NYN domain-containing protein n=1 Tax=Cyanothece sp. (strain PCC 7425 / ATCC 29141) TaxID=395961 RepID=B8HXD5_CYAP4